jgi:hypothetical protein
MILPQRSVAVHRERIPRHAGNPFSRPDSIQLSVVELYRVRPRYNHVHQRYSQTRIMTAGALANANAFEFLGMTGMQKT